MKSPSSEHVLEREACGFPLTACHPPCAGAAPGSSQDKGSLSLSPSLESPRAVAPRGARPSVTDAPTALSSPVTEGDIPRHSRTRRRIQTPLLGVSMLKRGW